jgi:hypothetical protein
MSLRKFACQNASTHFVTRFASATRHDFGPRSAAGAGGITWTCRQFFDANLAEKKVGTKKNAKKEKSRQK